MVLLASIAISRQSPAVTETYFMFIARMNARLNNGHAKHCPVGTYTLYSSASVHIYFDIRIFTSQTEVKVVNLRFFSLLNSILKRMCQITVMNFFSLGCKVQDSDLTHFLRFEIQPPLNSLVPLFKRFKGLVSLHNSRSVHAFNWQFSQFYGHNYGVDLQGNLFSKYFWPSLKTWRS